MDTTQLPNGTTRNDEAPQKGGKSWFAKTVAWIHLWPSLVSAIILIFVCLTGTIIVYGDEIMDFTSRDVRYVPEVKARRLPVEELIARFKQAYPTRKNPSYVVVYKDPARSVKMNSFDPKQGLRFIFMDPYTGNILKEDPTIHFFFVTAHLHSSLLLHKPGEWIIDIATLIFLIELITGLILWWPDKWNKTTRAASFTVKWQARFKRLNYDLHNVFGFFALSISLILTISGLIIAFPSWSSFTIQTFGGTASHEWEKKLPAFKPDRQPAAMNNVVARIFAEHPGKTEAQIMTFKLDSAGYYMVRVANRIGLKSADSPAYAFIDRYSGQTIPVSPEAELHEVVENGYWALHMGTWLGPVGKFLTFLGGLICTSLPITGFLIWWGRRKKNQGPRSNGRQKKSPQKSTSGSDARGTIVANKPYFPQSKTSSQG